MSFYKKYRIILKSKKRVIFSIISVIALSVACFVVAISCRYGNKKINSSILPLGENRIIIGGNNFSERDIKILENYPFVEYAVFPEAEITIDGLVYTGYSKKSFSFLGVNTPVGDEVVVDRDNFSEEKRENILDLSMGLTKNKFVIKDLYRNGNPFEKKNEINRVLLSQEDFERLFGVGNYKEILISFNKKDAKYYIPTILEKFKEERGDFREIRILEKPKIYENIVKIQNIVLVICGIFSAFFLGISSFGVDNFIVYSRRFNKNIMGIEEKTSVCLIEGAVIYIFGAFVGAFIGIIGLSIIKEFTSLLPIFRMKEFFLSFMIFGAFGVGVGIYSLIKK